jgi:sulfoxide reductase catalytic subunit YedY
MQYQPNPRFQSLRNEMTSEGAYMNRRTLVKAAGFVGAGALLAACRAKINRGKPGTPLKAVPTKYAVNDAMTPEAAGTGYNNFYEFGTQKEDPAKYAGAMTTSPWTVTVEGAAEKTGPIALEKLIDYSKLEERVYRHRCVEAWSMVLPWIGVPMASVIQSLGPKPEARFVQFESYLNKDEMPGTRGLVSSLNWPYVEALRIDEAMNELAFFAVGIYGKALPPQNGAPLRTVMPWKYGFKATKSVVKIRFLESQPKASWNVSWPAAYGFYSNVNPNVSHPNWSQAEERIIGGKGNQRRQTDMFNGYGGEVEYLYKDLDLVQNY